MNPLFDQRRYLIPFRGTLLPQVFTDTLVIGGGVAGLRAAIAAAQHGEVILLTKADLETSNTAWAQGGVAAPVGGAGDAAAPDLPSAESEIGAHVADTLRAGAGLCDADVVNAVVRAGPERLREALAWGLRVDRAADGRILLGREGGHGVPRILHALGDETGRELVRCLGQKVRATPGVRVFDRCFALDLLTPADAPGAPCMGAITHHPRYGLQMIWARATILATGGAGMLWRETSNPRVATADGVAMAYRAGARVADMAFMQFHPTTLYVAGAARSLISEAVRGEGAHLLDHSARRFMPDIHPMAELAPRDIVAGAIMRQIARDGSTHVFLDARRVERFAERFPSITAALADVGLDASRDLIPVHPAAHYMIGGVCADAAGRTSVPGLYAAGETSCSGLHGANRLASNSLLEGLVLGEAAGRACREMRAAPGSPGSTSNPWGVAPAPAPMQIISDIPLSDAGELDLTDVRASLRSVMWRNMGVERAGAKLQDVAVMFDFWARYTLDKIFDDPHGWETQNMLLAGALAVRSAIWRRESRGCHLRADCPAPSPEFQVHDAWRRHADAPETIAPASPAGAAA